VLSKPGSSAITEPAWTPSFILWSLWYFVVSKRRMISLWKQLIFLSVPLYRQTFVECALFWQNYYFSFFPLLNMFLVERVG